MSVYVDASKHRFRGMLMCHLMGDTIEELNAMADLIGMQRAWFQPHSFPHYDLSKSRRADAVRAGAISLTMREFVAKLRELRSQVPVAANWAYLDKDYTPGGVLVGHFLVGWPSRWATLCGSFVGSEPAVLTMSVSEISQCVKCAELQKASGVVFILRADQ